MKARARTHARSERASERVANTATRSPSAHARGSAASSFHWSDCLSCSLALMDPPSFSRNSATVFGYASPYFFSSRLDENDDGDDDEDEEDDNDEDDENGERMMPMIMMVMMTMMMTMMSGAGG